MTLTSLYFFAKTYPLSYRLGLTTAIFVQHESDTSRCSSGSHLLRLFLLGSLVLLGVTLIITVLLVVHSSRGTILTPLPRKHVPALIVTRCCLLYPSAMCESHLFVFSFDTLPPQRTLVSFVHTPPFYNTNTSSPTPSLVCFAILSVHPAKDACFPLHFFIDSYTLLSKHSLCIFVTCSNYLYNFD